MVAPLDRDAVVGDLARRVASDGDAGAFDIIAHDFRELAFGAGMER